MRLKAKLIAVWVAFLAAFSFASVTTVSAAKGDTGVDWSVYQGANGKFGYSGDKFVIAQIGGTYNGAFINQSTYKTQVASAIAAGKRAHTYIWYQVGGSTSVAKTALDHFLPMVQTPKGSIVALDYEAGASSSKQANTNAILYGLRRVKAAGYTPMLYGYKSYLVSHTDLATIAKDYQLWLAEYPDYNVTTAPNYGYFPSFDNVGIFQFTSTYRAGGLDGNVDLTGITDNGYGKATTNDKGKVTVKPKTSTPATKAGATANKATKTSITRGTKVKVNLSARAWANGVAIPRWVRGRTYTVQQTSGNRVLLAGILSWISKRDVVVAVKATSTATANSRGTYTVRYGDSWWSIAYKYGMSMYTLASRNGKTIYSMIHPSDVLLIR
ncbi:GH25 family lysozyme [Lacticaseibacillus mingshuiensis]|uniref:GH25 family lysozyme n=1 Tax=Lacticaseibacillus mingshuiensis TaxID=2799574 RepID=A0ABW4CFW3_9LACO|nr:GH25 family lysozyme [Lacticaseibacillus mingshuiensis]